ncbi:MAG: ribonuclease HI family protein [Candidatus Scalinduaceae bacterium]
MKKDSISDYELLALIHKNIDVRRLKKQNETITKTRIDKLFQNLRTHVKKSRLSISTGSEEKDVSSNKQFDILIINIDGASRGNPGKAGIGVAIFDKDSKLVKECSEYIGIATNNVAEYKALILGVKEVIKCSAQEILFKTDSELLARQIMGEYKVKNTQLMHLFTEVQGLLKKLPKWKIKHIPRGENKKADMLANKGIEKSNKNKLTNPPKSPYPPLEKGERGEFEGEFI